MTTEKAILSFVCIPPGLLIIQKGWPFFRHKLKVGVIVIEHGNGPGKCVSNVQAFLPLPT